MVRRRAAGLLAAMVVTATAAGCSDRAGSGTAEPVVRDSAGVTIVEHAGGAWEAGGAGVEAGGDTGGEPGVQPGRSPVWTVRFDEALELPGDFYQVAGAFRLEGGRVAVAEQSTRNITFFGPDGSRQHSAGGEGEGPGEFRAVTSAFRWPGDSIVVFDIQLRRLTLMDSQGELGRTFAFEVTDDAPFANLRGVSGDGSMLATGFAQTPADGPADGRQRYSSPGYSFDAEGGLQTTLPLGSDSESYFRRLEGGFTVIPTLFPRRTRVLAGPDYLLEAANDSWELRFRSLDGRLTRVARREGGRRAVTSELRRDAIERILEEDASSRDPAELRGMLEEMPVPDTLPAFDRVVIDRLGQVWVEEYEPEGAAPDPIGAAPPAGPRHVSEWVVVDPEGMIVGRVELPRRFEPMDVGEDYVLGVLTDELEVERVVLAPLVR